MRKLAHVDAIIDAKYVFDAMEWFQGKAIGEPKFRPVKHGGTDQENPETVVARPSAREFMMTFAGAHKRWQISEAITESAKYGFSKAAIYTANNVLVGEKVFKKTGPGAYALTAKGLKATATNGTAVATRAPGRKTGKRLKPEGTTMMDKVLAGLKAAQNGSGDGVPLATIRDTMKTKKNISPYLRDLVAEKLVTRTAPGMYRANAN